MDKLVKQRAATRRLITLTVNNLENDLVADPKDVIELRTKNNKLITYMDQIGPLDQQILDLIMEDPNSTDAHYDDEALAIDVYSEKVIKAKLKIEVALDGDQKDGRSTEDDFHSTCAANNNKRRYKLPKIELKKFSGKIIDWLSWWALFEKIDDDDELSAADKFQYLLQSVDEGSRAHDTIKGFPATADNYPKVIKVLKDRFGNKSLLTQVYIRELFQMGLKNLQEKPELFTIYDKLVGHVQSLESLGITVEQATLFLYPMVEASLTEDVMIAWQRSTLYEADGTQEQPPKGKLDFLLEFLRQEVEREEQRRLMRVGFFDAKDKLYQKRKETSYTTAAGLHVNQNVDPTVKIECVFCEKRHPSHECYSTKAKPLTEIWKIIKQKRICAKCLKIGHFAFKCRSKENIRCDDCSQMHYRILCPKSNEKKVVASNSGSNNIANTIVILKTIMVAVNSETGPIIVRALFDDGSHRSYTTTRLAHKIKGKQIGKFFERNTLFGGILSDIEERTIYEVSVGPVDKKPSFKLEIADKEKITGKIQRLPKGDWLEELQQKGIWINDYESNSEEPDILIGADLIPKLTTDRSVTLQSGLKAVETVFGWTIIGPIQQTNQLCVSLAMSVTTEQIDELQFKQLWDLETIGIRDPVEVKTIEKRNQQTKEYFSTTVTRKADGRYQVALLWVSGKQILPNNFNTALKRLMNTSNKLKHNGMYETYDNLFKQWEAEDFIEQIDIDDPMVKKCGNFIPHHAVYKPESKTTPVRPVFDASCKVGRHPSLNECLEKGPNLIELLPATIIRFRENRIGCLADIRKAFQMIEVQETDQFFLLFIWWEDESCEKVIIFKHKRVVFGLKSSPFILAAVIEMHLENVNEEDKEIAVKLKKSLYVDNVVTSMDSWDDYLKFKTKSVKLMAEAQMELRQWEHTSISGMECNNESTEMAASVLGLKWCKKKDTLSCSSFPVMPEKLSKRTLLATINKIYDPMGILSPAMLTPKLMFQSTWKDKLKWDDELPKDLKSRFEQWISGIHYLAQIEIPRFMKGEFYEEQSSNEQLHVFCDASSLAYAAGVFMRAENSKGVSLQLIQSKARVAPIDKVTMPRMELMACTIGARLGDSVLKALQKDIPCFYWSDSTTALAWIKRNDEWGTFVGNRVREIISLSPADRWIHVPGNLNPADLPSRGCTPKQLLDSSWWEGPWWLKQTKSEWPNQDFCCDEEKINMEKKKVISPKNTLSNIPNIVDLPWFATKSSYVINLRRMAMLRRFIHNALAKKNNEERKTGYLTMAEINDTEAKMVQLTQEQVFPSNADVIAGLRVAKEKGIYYVVTKIMNRQDSGRFRKPWLLPSNHPIVKQLIIEEHLRYGHAGVQFLVSKLREKFWIIRMKKTVGRIIQKCTVCIRFQKSTASVPTTPLPENRVKNAKVFEISGIDLAGPLYLRDNSKQWVVIFTCAVLRAVHLELVEKIDTEHFIMALGRFIYRRGRISIIYTDNGTNFQGTVNLFGRLDWDKIQIKFKTERITWIFNPPAAPWWGGFWERMVRTMKEYLRKILGHNKLTKVELDTTICFVESLINARPLTHLREDPDDLLPVTPSAFIQDVQSSEYPEIEEITGKRIREKLQHLNQLKQELRSRFRSEYLGQLIEKSKSSPCHKFEIGEMVIVQMDDKKRIDWPLARITHLFPGNDSQIRVARLKTSNGELVRALNRLIPMELDNEEQLPITTETEKNASKIQEISIKVPIVEADSKVSKKKVKIGTEALKEKPEEIGATKTTRSGRRIVQPSRLQYV